jgi:NAD(P)-dependent dehydrogenase (short-subunit alcohol dehydrogenase family)
VEFLNQFKEKRVLITGASRGIGRATAEAYLSAGARVAINGRSESSVSKALAEFDAGDRVVAAPGDVAEVNGCEALVKAAIDGLGGLDILINSAGIFSKESMEDSDEAFWDSTMDINVKGTYFCSRAALPALRESQGNIVNLASIAGLEGYSDLTVYCASKGAIVNLTRAMAMELAPKVRVNCVCPGVIDTDMARNELTTSEAEAAAEMAAKGECYPMQRIGTVEEVASAILYLSSSDAGFITGVALPVEGGITAGS